MDKELNILSLMVNDHNEIESLIGEFDESIDKDYDEMKKAFEKFEWKLEKHLFVEEKAIFTFYEPIDVSEGYKMLPVIMKQHNFILNSLHQMRKNVNNGLVPKDHLKLKDFLHKHKNYEEKEVYPKLDEVLSKEQKQQIIDRINEFI